MFGEPHQPCTIKLQPFSDILDGVKATKAAARTPIVVCRRREEGIRADVLGVRELLVVVEEVFAADGGDDSKGAAAAEPQRAISVRGRRRCRCRRSRRR